MAREWLEAVVLEGCSWGRNSGRPQSLSERQSWIGQRWTSACAGLSSQTLQREQNSVTECFIQARAAPNEGKMYKNSTVDKKKDDNKAGLPEFNAYLYFITANILHAAQPI